VLLVTIVKIFFIPWCGMVMTGTWGCGGAGRGAGAGRGNCCGVGTGCCGGGAGNC